MSQDLSILTITLGRDTYLRRLLQSILNDESDLENIIKEHVFVVQGSEFDEKFNNLISDLELLGGKFKVIRFPQVKSVGTVLSEVVPTLESDLVLKLDDDAVIRSPYFFDSLMNIHGLVGDAIFSPYPVGLINNPGGPTGFARKVIYSEKDDTYYTLRSVDHVGGFARISPKSHLLNTKFSNGHNEDGELSANCRNNGIPMFYLENGLIVEHQESTLGQHERYKEYFKGRF